MTTKRETNTRRETNTKRETTTKRKTQQPNAPLIVLKGDYKSVPITIYGEEHNNIDNTIYEEMDLSDKIVLVEHSTVFAELKKGEEKLFTGAQGSEWIWFTRTVAKQPVVCIDDRLENGFLNRIEEQELQQGTASLEELFKITKHILMTTQKIKEKYKPIKEVYMNLIGIIQKQIGELLLLLKSGSGEKRENLIVKENLIQNLLKLSSLSVDMNIVDFVEKYASAAASEKKEIVIFVGAAHAIRLQEIFGLSLLAGDIKAYEKSALSFIYKGGKKRNRLKN